MLAATNLSFAYSPSRPVLRGVSLALKPGSVMAIIGPNGAGKSTLLRLLVGVLRPGGAGGGGGGSGGGGEVTIDDRPLAGLSHRERARCIAYVPQRTSLAFAYSVRQYVALGRYSAESGDDIGAVERALARLELTERASDPLPELSAGQQQRAALARALAQLDAGQGAAAAPTRALLADEPASAMDPAHAHAAMQLLREQADRGLAVGVVLHDLTLALRWCDQAAVLAGDGSLAAAGPVAEVLTPRTLEGVFGIRFVHLEVPGGAAALIASPH
jgi:iron complex transport system ATP-binding protein